MNRLTERNKNNEIVIKELGSYQWLDEDDWARVANNLASKLADYEDTCLAPEEIVELKNQSFKGVSNNETD